MTTHLSEDWRLELVMAYPDLFHPVGDPPGAEGWPSVGDGSKVEMDVVMVVRDDGIFALDVVPARARITERHELVQRALRDLGHACLIVTAEDLDAEPARSNRDLVWSHRGRTVAVDRRLEILRILVDDGPLPLDRLLRGVSGRDPAASVMALACADLLELDLESAPLGPSTEVRSRT
ncbi:hypothetical protein [Bradyrhizobium diazoefficiens]|uniref:TnsA endonuclease N-terminal domain-containing protein n=1 Tax=Bradyrhizobium diazoefficiens TaxID=1355477 RepID=A0A809WRH9_9BRAD|nr:hypothetical protein XF1B_04950 [Bradyrhizobium diazoefficiens]BCF22542.1 hypothetical protein XF14B_04940 [Bradyrhizobium diazoefficiens]